MMDEGLDFYGFLVLPKIGLCTLVLPERVKLADEKLAACDERLRRFIENGIEILDVLEHKVTNDELERSSFRRPWFRQVGTDEEHVVCFYFRPRLQQHSRREVQR